MSVLQLSNNRQLTMSTTKKEISRETVYRNNIVGMFYAASVPIAKKYDLNDDYASEAKYKTYATLHVKAKKGVVTSKKVHLFTINKSLVALVMSIVDKIREVLDEISVENDKLTLAELIDEIDSQTVDSVVTHILRNGEKFNAVEYSELMAASSSFLNVNLVSSSSKLFNNRNLVDEITERVGNYFKYTISKLALNHRITKSQLYNADFIVELMRQCENVAIVSQVVDLTTEDN